MLTKRDYANIAHIFEIRVSRLTDTGQSIRTLWNVAYDLGRLFKEGDDKFDLNLFIAACGLLEDRKDKE